MQAYVTHMLQCPACHGHLTWAIQLREGERIIAAEAQCDDCGATYPVRDGIGIFLTPDLPRDDAWDASGSTLLAELQGHPEIAQQLMGVPCDSLNPTDQFYRAGVLRAQGHYAEAKRLGEIAYTGLYTREQQAVTSRQNDHLITLLQPHEGPIVDLASGVGTLADLMLQRLPNPIIMTDFNLRALRENQHRLTALGLCHRVSLLAFDARRTPFADGAVRMMTTLAGLGNIEQPGTLLQELRRVVSGHLLALCQFFPEDDQHNGQLLRECGMEQLNFRRLALAHFAAAGWCVTVSDAELARVEPTPQSNIFPGSTVDGLPVAPTTVEFCVLDAH